jgi:hypothetical protein
VKRIIPVLLAAVALGGCGTAAAPLAPKPVVPVSKHVRVVPKSVFIRRVNRICATADHRGDGIGAFPKITADVARNRRQIGGWFGRLHRIVRTERHRLGLQGQPAKGGARWLRAMSKLRAVEHHLDTIRASAWSGSADILVLDWNEAVASSKSANRRFRRFGAKRCAFFS